MTDEDIKAMAETIVDTVEHRIIRQIKEYESSANAEIKLARQSMIEVRNKRIAKVAELLEPLFNRLSIIAADANAIGDEWLVRQPDGIRMAITNIREHSKLKP